MPLTTEEIVQLYKDMIPKIFKKAKANRGYRVVNRLFSCIKVPLIPYTQEVMMEELHKIYGDIKTSEIGDKDSCIAGRLHFFDFFITCMVSGIVTFGTSLVAERRSVLILKIL